MVDAFDIFSIARNVTRAWLAADSGNARADVLSALSAPQDGGKGKHERRLSVGWFIASPRGGWHRLDAVQKRQVPGLEKAPSIAAVIGANTIADPLVVVRLGKAGLKDTDFAISYGDQLRIGEAGKEVRLIDLRRVRALLPLLATGGKPSGRAVHEARRALKAARLGRDATLPPPEIATVVDAATDAEVSYAAQVAIHQYETRKTN